MNFSIALLLLALHSAFAGPSNISIVTLTTFLTSTITVTSTEYFTVTVSRTRLGESPHTVSSTSTTFTTNTKTLSSTVTSTKSPPFNDDIKVNFTTTVEGPAQPLPGSYDFESLEFTSSIAREGTIYSFTDYEGIVSGRVKGICGLKVNPLSRYWAAISRKYLRADPVYYTNPNVHPLCLGNICIEVFGPRGRMVGQIFDSFESLQSAEDIVIAGTSFESIGYDGSVGNTIWRFVPCPKKDGLGIFLK